jgi:MFS transporter, PPP family, 3-phenylpropionic acid transporter
MPGNKGTDEHLEMTAGKVKMIYLLMYMGFAFWRVFYNVYLEEIGFSGAAIGTLNAIMQASVIVVLPIWGMVADKNGIRPTLRWLILTAAVLVFMLGFIKIFYVLIVYILILTIFHHPLGPLADALAVQYSHIDKKHSYGSFRSWGSLGWAIASIIGGVIFTYVDIKYVFPLAAILFICTAYFLRTPKKRKTIYRPDFQPIDFRLILKDYHLLFFVIILSIYGIACSPVNAYINLYFKELGAKNDAIGLAYAIQAFSEVPFFFIGGRLVKKFGAKRVILISMAVMVIRLFIYGITSNIAIALTLGVLQGITLSFFLVGAVDFMHKLLPAGRHATAQSFIWGLYFGVGHTIGNLSIGVLKDLKGMAGVMNIFGYIAVAVLLITFLYFYLSRFKKQTKQLYDGSEFIDEIKPPEL